MCLRLERCKERGMGKSCCQTPDQPVRECRKSARRTPDEIRPASAPAARSQRAMDSRCMGTAGGFHPQRRHPAAVWRTV